MIIIKKLCFISVFIFINFFSSYSLFATQLSSPEGVRPCCAFGVDLKASVGSVPVPFFSMDNVVSVNTLGKHQYNDGTASVIGSLFGVVREKNGIIYTKKGGFIDIAHVRDTADYTFYLYQHIVVHLGSDYSITLHDELRTRVIKLNYNKRLLSNVEHQGISAKLSGLLAFQLAQWHEIAQWYGLRSVGGWPEAASAFSPEDLYSNMLGANIAINIITMHNNLTLDKFLSLFEKHLVENLHKLGATNSNTTRDMIRQFDGIWWDSNERLPNKWIVTKRDYCLRHELMPNGISNGQVDSVKEGQKLSLEPNLAEWGQLTLVASDHEHLFSLLPQSLKNKPVWFPVDFPQLAKFAYEQDKAERQDVSVCH